MNWITKNFILLLFIASVLADHYGERQRQRRKALKNSPQRYLTYVSRPPTAALRYSEQLNKKNIRAVIFYTFDDKPNKNGIEKYELNPELFEKLIKSKEFVGKSENPQSASSLVSFLDGKCDISINCQQECADVKDLCPCPNTTPFKPVTGPSSTTPPVTGPTTTSPPVTGPPSTTPPVTGPSTTTPPVTGPSTTTPPVTGPFSTTPPVTGPSTTTPPVTGPSTTTPPVTGPSTTTPPVTGPSTTTPPVTGPSTTTPPVTGPSTTTPPVTGPSTTTPPVTGHSSTTPPVTGPTKTTTSRSTSSTTTTKPTTVTKTYIPPPGVSRVPYTRWVGSYRQYTGQFSFGYTWKPFTGGISWRSRRYTTGSTTTTERYRQRSLINELNPINNEI